MKKYFTFLIALLGFYLHSNAQFTHTGRGMYVDKFFRTAVNPAGATVPNPVFSILSFPAKEDSLLRYARDNHITYLILYDLHRVFGNPVYESYLCSFMQKAKTQYCIEKIGVASSCASMFDNIAMVAASQPVDFSQSRYSSYSNDDKQQLRFATQALQPGDTSFLRSEMSKLAMMVTAFNDNCAYKFDVMVTEFEFWNPGADDCTGQSLTKDQKYLNFQGMIGDMDVIRDNYNASHAHQIYVEAYLGYLNQNTAYTHQAIANWIDGMAANGKRRVDRINMHFYGQNPLTLYSRTSAGQNYPGYYQTRFLDFCQSTTNNRTNFSPILSSEYISWGAGYTYLGVWMNQNRANNIFTAEKAFYNDWYTDAVTYSPGVIGSATQGTVVSPGNVVWFTAGQMSGHLNRPLMFTSNSPVCVATGQNGTFQFQYQGPIEQCTSYKFYITNANTTTLRCGTTNSIAWPAYDAATQVSINLNSALGACSLPVGDYDAHLDLTYSTGCNYSQVMRVSVVNTGRIVALTPTTVCAGNPVFLQASSPSSGATTYQWYEGATAIAGATTSTYAPGAASAGVHNYNCRISSTVSGCSVTPSNSIAVTINAYPAASISPVTSTGCNAVLQANPANAAYQWHDGSTTRNYTTTLAGSYSVAVTVNGCTSVSTYNYSKPQLLLASQTTTCSGGQSGSLTVNISGGVAPYALSWSGAATGSLSGLAAGNRTISNLPAGTYNITVTDGSGCSATLAPAPVVASYAAIVVNTSTTPATCPGSANGSASITSVTGGNGGPFTYHWLYNNSTGGSLSNITPGTYVVEVSDGVSCTVTKNITVTAANATVVPSLTIASSLGTAICSGASVTFNATPVNGGTTPSYQWKKNGVAVGTNSSTYTVSGLANNDVITCVMTSNAPCASPSTATSNNLTMAVTANVATSVTITPAPSPMVCSGTTVTFTAATVNGGASPAYQWKRNGTNIGSNSATYTSAVLSNNDVITCIVTASAGCFVPSTDTSNSITMTVNPMLVPSVSISSPSGTSVCAGANVIFNASAINGGTTPAYQWKKNGVNVGTNSSSYSLSTLANNDVITCVLTSNATCATPATAASNSLTMTVNPVVSPSVSVSVNPGTTICSGTNVSFSATPVNGGASPAYQWKKNGNNTGVNSPTYSSFTLADSDIISCTMTSNAACLTAPSANSNSITMLVNQNVSPSVTITASPGVNVCPGTIVTYTAVAVNGGVAPSYQWKKNGIAVGTNNSTYSTSSLLNNDVITCELTSNFSCLSSNGVVSNALSMQIVASVTPSISISSAAGNSICSGTTVTFSATISGGGNSPAFQWKKNGVNAGTNSSTFTSSSLSNNDVISCVLTSNDPCAVINTVTSNAVMLQVTPSVNASITVTASPGSVICSGTPVQFNATITNGGAQPIYQWKKNGINVGTNSTTYNNSSFANNDIITCVLTSNATCVSQPVVPGNLITMTVDQVVIPSVTISSLQGDSVCDGTNVQFTATAVNGGISPSFQWKINGVNAGTGNSFASSVLLNGDAVSCVLTGSANCASTATATSNMITMNVYPVVTPSVIISAAGGNVICPNASVQFTAVAVNGGSNPVYQWKRNGTSVGTNAPAYSAAGLSNFDSITCLMTSNAACTTTPGVTSNSISMTVNPMVTPSVSITANPGPSFCSGTIVSFSTLTTNAGANPSYQWKRNGINISTGNTFSSNALQDGDLITCIVTSSDACADPDTAASNPILMNATAAIVPSVSIVSDHGNTFCVNDTVKFSATPLNGGNAPAFQWRINGIAVGSNNSLYTTSALQNHDTVACEMTSNAGCAILNPAVSNKIGNELGTCGITLTLKTFIQGFYEGNGRMRAVADPLSAPTVCDTISVSFMNPSPPYNSLYSFKEVIDIYGTGVYYLPNILANESYYIVIRHRNSLEAWSQLPLMATSNMLCDFTVSDSAAYGSNLVSLGDGNYALWSGDVGSGNTFMQDGIINEDDYAIIQDAAHTFNTGYKNSDITGDGFIESADFSMIENNKNMFIVVQRP